MSSPTTSSSLGSTIGAICEFLSLFINGGINTPRNNADGAGDGFLKISDASDLDDGVAFHRMLGSIDPIHFDPHSVAVNLGDNWALKGSNLRKLIRKLEDYLYSVLNKNCQALSSVDLSKISRNADPSNIISLFEIILAAAISSENRNAVVASIMNLTPDNQAMMKVLIERGMSTLIANDDEQDDQLTPQNETPSSFRSRRNSENGEEIVFDDPNEPKLRDQLTEKTKANDELQSQVEQLVAERDSLKSQLLSSASSDRLQILVEDLQSRLDAGRVEKDKIASSLTASKRSLEDLNAKYEDLLVENGLLADELDVARDKAAQLIKVEATVQSLRRQLEATEKRLLQANEHEERANKYYMQVLKLEQAIKKTEEEALERDKLAANAKEVEEKGTAAKLQEEVRQLRQALATAERVKRQAEDETKVLREQKEAAEIIKEDGESDADNWSQSMNKMVVESKEQNIRLQHENQSLKDQVAALQSTHEENDAAFRAHIEDLKSQLKKRDTQIAALASDKAKLESYTKKTLHKFQEKYLVALQECKGKLKAKHDYIQQREAQSNMEKMATKREERLLSSAIYELGLELINKRLGNSGGGKTARVANV
uniref:HOOK N-terminal domain-containing protein n=1 Tax=Corethron hystrix TaxID=216773 RepID=A0A7S1G1I6_9STRA|mmetsp:Transcript_6762/g.14558  ORF Transcript_6762/g.14558 Transcript_6762/m.14558 type:complete len:601 (+) Transcript_6762:237-2039(+)|eukprot:CAMPEP_0113308376 /NCGR_PEP_ID=MMETSP0010_2-20120614/6835_1 /TAXON_ID=216773 ORGANISM="Corethron hystrix, Strain 308" /NCGR_SAMPLE_ID=MMETSP0010_2 /ASSEMBLY_ACC=CAM_ASM_000155 /LENGTH=600 /DNA_ID=CAMNT_0000163397 /DNA_START=112 /DNA_END=1914 /DNA_ORIENTATION=+ /assembly_acc=CAM_ASM_000155